MTEKNLYRAETAVGPCIIIEGYDFKAEAYTGFIFPRSEEAAALELRKTKCAHSMHYLPEGKTQDVIIYKRITNDEWMKKQSDWAGDYEFSGRD